MQISKALTNFENHRTDQGYENALTQKIFVLNFLTGYMSLFLTAYVYGISCHHESNCDSPLWKLDCSQTRLFRLLPTQIHRRD